MMLYHAGHVPSISSSLLKYFHSVLLDFACLLSSCIPVAVFLLLYDTVYLFSRCYTPQPSFLIAFHTHAYYAYNPLNTFLSPAANQLKDFSIRPIQHHCLVRRAQRY